MAVSRLGAHYGWPYQGLCFDGFWLLFAAGVAVYYWVNYAAGLSRKALAGLLLAGAAAAARRPSALLARDANFTQFCFAAFLFALLLMALHRRDRALAASRWMRPLGLCGRMCYSLYLVHWPVVKALSHALYWAGVHGPRATLLVTTPLCLVCSIGAGWVFHRLVERRFLNPPLEKADRAPASSRLAFAAAGSGVSA